MAGGPSDRTRNQYTSRKWNTSNRMNLNQHQLFQFSSQGHN